MSQQLHLLRIQGIKQGTGRKTRTNDKRAKEIEALKESGRKAHVQNRPVMGRKKRITPCTKD